MRSLGQRVESTRVASLAIAGVVLFPGTCVIIGAPLPGVVWTAVADNQNGGSQQSGDHRGSGGDRGTRPNPSPSGADRGKGKAAAPPPAQPVAQTAHPAAPAAHPAAPAASLGSPSILGATAPAPAPAGAAPGLADAAQPAAALDGAATEGSGQPLSTLPGQLISSSPVPATSAPGLFRLVVLVAWALLSAIGIVLVRRRIGRAPRVEDFVPMTLGTYAFRR
ncbi:MAG TPA: hypothetical protein VG329_03615 [Candidatus Dormibacteraeota bacterium]|nr:hypothetical protein [Candidatus Dormibacteraeota bacterium]